LAAIFFINGKELRRTLVSTFVAGKTVDMISSIQGPDKLSRYAKATALACFALF
jgi:hypothetical protein